MSVKSQTTSAVMRSAAALALLATTASGIDFKEAKARIERAETPDHKAIETLMCVEAGLRDQDFIALGAAVCAEALKEEDAMTRYYAARALAGFDESALPVVLQAMGDQDPNVRTQALRAMGAIGGEDAISMLAEAASAVIDAGEREAAMTGLATLPCDDMDKKLAEYAADQDELPEARAMAVCALVARGAVSAVPALMKAAVGDPEVEVRSACLKALGKLAGVDSAAAVLDALKAASDDGERLAAADALAAIIVRAGTPAAEVERILAALDKASEQVQPALLAALALTGGETAMDKMEDFLLSASTDDEDKMIVLERLGKSQSRDVLEFLIRTLDDMHEGIMDNEYLPQIEDALIAAAEAQSKIHPEEAISAFNLIKENSKNAQLAKRAEDAIPLAWIPSF